MGVLVHPPSGRLCGAAPPFFVVRKKTSHLRKHITFSINFHSNEPNLLSTPDTTNSPGLCPGRVRSRTLCNKKCSKNSNTFFNKFCLTFVSTLTNWTELLNFSATVSLFLHRLRFFPTNPEQWLTIAQTIVSCLKKRVREGGLSGSHPASPLSVPEVV